LQDGAKIEDFKYLSKGKYIFGSYLISITSLPGDEHMSKHGAEGRYNAIYSSRVVIKNIERKREEKKEIKKKIYNYEKEKEMSMYKNKIN
jgi:hypothetical protein